MDPLHRSAGPRNSTLYYSYLFSFSASCASSSSSSRSTSSYFYTIPVSSSSLSYALAALPSHLLSLSLSLYPQLSPFPPTLPTLPTLKASLAIHPFFILFIYYILFHFLFSPGTHGADFRDASFAPLFSFSLFITLHSLLAVDCISLVHLFGHRFLIRSRARIASNNNNNIAILLKY